MVAAGAVLLVALAVRLPLLPFVSGDYSAFVSNWYDHLASAGFAGLADNFSNYNPPYLYLLYLATALPVSKIVAIKAISIIFDLLLGLFAYRIVALYRPGWWPALAAAGVVLLTPTVVLNGAEWAQCDSIYASFCLGSMYFLLCRRPYWAAAFFAAALAFKLQAVFFAPVALIVLLVQRERVRRVLGALLLVPLVYLAALVPALLAGASWADLLAVYPNQIAGGGVSGAGGGGGNRTGGGFGGGRSGGAGGGGFGGLSGGGQGIASSQYRGGLTYNATSFYQLLPASAGSGWKYVGFLLTGLSIAGVGTLALLRRARVGLPQLMLLASTLLIAIPFFLPSMHDRYFFLADVFTVVTCFLVPRYWPAAVAVQLASLTAYASYLWSSTAVPLWVGTLAALLGLAWSLYLLVRSLTGTGSESDASGSSNQRNRSNAALTAPVAEMSASAGGSAAAKRASASAR